MDTVREERLGCDRHLSSRQKEAILERLSGQGHFKVLVMCMEDTAEPWVYADEFIEILKDLGWDVIRKCSKIADAGVFVGVSDLSAAKTSGADLLLKALQDAGIALTYDHVTRVAESTTDRCWLEVGYEPSSSKLRTRL